MKKILFLLLLAVMSTSYNYGQADIAPHTENFASGILPTNWSLSATTGGPWDFNGIVWNTGSCAPAPSDNTLGGGGNFASMDFSGTDVGVIMEMNDIDVAALTVPYLEFYWYMCNVSPSTNELYVEVWDGTVWNIALTELAGTSGWEMRSLVLTGLAYTGTLVKIRFRTESGGGTDFQADIAIDDVSVIEAPTCPNPSNLTATAINANSASANWVTGGALVWLIEYGPAGFVPGTGTIMVTSNNPETIGGLMPNTAYTICVSDFCAIGDTSSQICADVTTPCSIFAVPYLYEVETAATTTNSTIADCWESSPAGVTNAFRWNVTGTGTTGSGGTGALVAVSGVKYFYTEGSSGGTGAQAELLSPIFDVTSLTTPALEFYYHMHGSNIDRLIIDAFDGTTWTAVDSIIGQQQVNATDAWALKTVFLPGYNTSLQIRFRGIRGAGFRSDICIDDIRILEAPTCFLPTSLTVSGVTTTTADLSWVTGGAFAWIVEYGPAGFTPGTGAGVIQTVGTNPFTATGLNPATNYDWYVQDLCSATDTGGLVGPSNFVTPGTCGTFTLELYDSFGDGWNGGFLNIEINGVVVYPGVTLPAGAGPLVLNIPLNINDIVYIDYVGGGFQAENQYIFYNEGGTVIVDEGAAGIPNDLTIYQACPTCPRPSNLMTSGITATTADLAWTTGGASSWIIEYGPAGFIPGSGTGTTIVTTTNPHALTGLSQSILYDVYVQDSCGLVDGISIYSDVATFGTPCGIATAPYYESFDAALNLPYCWATAGTEAWLYRNSGTVGVFPSPNGGVANSADHTTGSGNYTWIDASGGIGANELESPMIDFSGLTQGIVGCWVRSNNTNDAALNIIQIEAFNGTTWDTLTTYSGNDEGWRRVYAIIPATIPTTTTFRLVQDEGTAGGNAFNNDVLVDDFFVEEAPTCFNPTNIMSTILNPTTVELAWTTGGATNWIIEYGAPGFIPGFGAGTLISTSVNPLVLSVNSGQDYDWYVQDSCNVNDISWYSYVDNFRMPGEVLCDTINNFTYCHPDESIESFTYQSENGTSQLHFVFNSGIIGNFVDFTIYDGPDNTFPVLFSTTGGTNMAGIEFAAVNSIVTFDWNSQFANVCTTPLDFDVNCCVATSSQQDIFICVDSTYTLADGVVIANAGGYTSVIPNVLGCDSTISYFVLVLPDTVNVSDDLCNGDIYTFADGSTTNVGGVYQATVPNQNGCDSTINYTIDVLMPSTGSMTASVCQGDFYILPDGSTASTAGNHIATITNAVGCDSVITVNLVVNLNTAESVNAQICEGESYDLPDGVSATTTGTYSSTVLNGSGCDHVVTTNLTVAVASFSDVVIELCGEETYTLLNGDVVGESGEYNVNVENSAGCDSIVTVYVSKCNAIDDLDGGSVLSIFPNPASVSVNIVLNDLVVNNKVKLKIVNALGQTIYETQEINNNTLKINVEDFSVGMYFIVLSDNESFSLHKFMISK